MNEWCSTTGSYDDEKQYGFCHESCVQDKTKFLKGEKWEQTAANGRKMLCECLGNGNSEWHCDYIDMCE